VPKSRPESRPARPASPIGMGVLFLARPALGSGTVCDGGRRHCNAIGIHCICAGNTPVQSADLLPLSCVNFWTLTLCGFITRSPGFVGR
jgi:hypothetical protein